MKNIAWVAFWLGLFTFFSIWVVTDMLYSKPDANDQAKIKCIKNNGVPVLDLSGNITDCKIYKK